MKILSLFNGFGLLRFDKVIVDSNSYNFYYNGFKVGSFYKNVGSLKYSKKLYDTYVFELKN